MYYLSQMVLTEMASDVILFFYYSIDRVNLLKLKIWISLTKSKFSELETNSTMNYYNKKTLLKLLLNKLNKSLIWTEESQDLNLLPD
jgi:hypothetical protein